jgi:hypothetical protein
MKPAMFGTQSGMDGMRKKVFLKKISPGKNHKQMVEIKSAMVEKSLSSFDPFTYF